MRACKIKGRKGKMEIEPCVGAGLMQMKLRGCNARAGSSPPSLRGLHQPRSQWSQAATRTRSALCFPSSWLFFFSLFPKCEMCWGYSGSQAPALVARCGGRVLPSLQHRADSHRLCLPVNIPAGSCFCIFNSRCVLQDLFC